MINQREPRRAKRKGTIAVLAALMLVVLFAMIAFAVEVGSLLLARAEAQRTADSAAMAAAWDMIADEYFEGYYQELHDTARQRAVDYAALNDVRRQAPHVDHNWSNKRSGDVVMGRLTNPSDPSSQLTYGDPSSYNAIRVRVSRTANQNGSLPFFFGQMLGVDSASISAQATAAFLDDISGFRVTETSGKSTLMPFVVHEDVWKKYQHDPTSFPDGWTYDASADSAAAGADGTSEIRMFAQGGNKNGNGKGSGQLAPGNFGTVDIGDPNNSSSELWRQIRQGPSREDLEWHGGQLALDRRNKQMVLTGETGMSVSMKEALAEIVGQPRTIMLYREVTASGNTAQFVITGFLGVTVVDFSLTGSEKYIQVQPTVVVDRTAISTSLEGTSRYVVQPARLVR